MGSSGSRSLEEDDENVITIRKQIGRRSSLNILKRIDTRSTPAPTLPTQCSPSGIHGSKGSQAISDLADNPRNTSSPHSSGGSDTTTVIHDTRRDSAPRGSGIFTALTLQSDEHRAQTPEIIPDSQDPTEHGRFSRSSGDQIDWNKTPTKAPMLPTPSFLGEESPTKYGLDATFEFDMDDTMSQAKRRTTSGPELFKNARTLQVTFSFLNSVDPDSPTNRLSSAPASSNDARPSHTSVARDESYQTVRRVYPEPFRPRNDRSGPEHFHRLREHQHPHDKQNVPNHPRIARLHRTHFPGNLFRDSPKGNVALAMPMFPSQKSCHRRHELWHQIPGSTHPVECSVCLSPSDWEGTVCWICAFCALRLCGECKVEFEHGDVSALAARYKDGKDTPEATVKASRPRGRKVISRSGA